MTVLNQPSLVQKTNSDINSNLHMGVIRLPKLLQIWGISRSTVYLKINKQSKYYDQNFPRPIKLGEKAVGWMLNDVFEYLERIKSLSKYQS